MTLHLSFLGHQPETHGDGAADEVRRWLDDGLARLERLVTGARRAERRRDEAPTGSPAGASSGWT